MANKIDLNDERVVIREEGEGMAKNYHMEHFETSAKTGENVSEVFEQIIKEAYVIKQVRESIPSFIIKNESSSELKKRNCCK